MGSNPTQAVGITIFLVAFTTIAAGLAMGSILLLLLGLVLLGVSCGVFLKCKPWEHAEN